MGILSSFLHPSRPYKKAQEQLDNYHQQAQGYIQPYMQQGQEAYGPLSEVMQRLLNPEQLQSDWMQGYETSPYAQMLGQEATQSGLNAASSLGLMGSSPALQAIQQGTSRIVAQDRDNYMNNLMQKYLSGAGIAQGLYGQGAQAGSQLGQMSMNQGQNMAEMAYGREAAPGQLFGNLLGMGMGSVLGGPIGGALANRFIGPYGS